MTSVGDLEVARCPVCRGENSRRRQFKDGQTGDLFEMACRRCGGTGWVVRFKDWATIETRIYE